MVTSDITAPPQPKYRHNLDKNLWYSKILNRVFHVKFHLFDLNLYQSSIELLVAELTQSRSEFRALDHDALESKLSTRYTLCR